MPKFNSESGCISHRSARASSVFDEYPPYRKNPYLKLDFYVVLREEESKGY